MRKRHQIYEIYVRFHNNFYKFILFLIANLLLKSIYIKTIFWAHIYLISTLFSFVVFSHFLLPINQSLTLLL